MEHTTFANIIAFLLLGALGACSNTADPQTTLPAEEQNISAQAKTDPRTGNLPKAGSFGEKLAQAAVSIVDPTVRYTPDYVVLSYPGGDVPAGTGVCTDVVIRSLRKLDIDLQKEVHEDMKKNFSLYPKTWGLKSADKNIDHRRVPNLMKYFERKGYSQPITQYGKDYLPGDIVTWVLSNGLTHIGVVSNNVNRDGNRYKIVHNIGGGQVEEDVLFEYKVTGHYRLK
ncbi:MAG: DUF1287 domain-containing protein [Sphingobacteriales bacterium]|nr:MAG: DUF1287 domain-containing protein [Sphingobacteriales bacterium]